jgi:hypothetical protein
MEAHMDARKAIDRLISAAGGAKVARERLAEAASTVADLVIEQCEQAGVSKLPRGWEVRRVKSNVGGYAVWLERETGCERYTVGSDATGGYLSGDFSTPLPTQCASSTRKFAADVALGLLEEISAALEDRTRKDLERAATLDAARGKLAN